MRRLTVGSLVSLFLILGGTPIAVAETNPSAEPFTPSRQQNNVRDAEAFNLVASAYRGEFKEQGIPSYTQFEQAYISGELNAESLVNSAIAAGELSSEAIEDEAYLNAVTLQLDALAGQSLNR